MSENSHILVLQLKIRKTLNDMAKKVQIERNREFILILLRCSLSWGTNLHKISEL